MRLNALELRDIGPYRHVKVDFRQLAGPLTAIIGETGQGKSFLVESWPGAMYRRFPSRGTSGKLHEVAHGRAASITADIVADRPYRIVQTVDAESRGGESAVYDSDGNPLRDEDGNPVLDAGKRRKYDVWAAEHLTDPDVFYAAQFGTQGSLGFLDLKPSERKGVYLRLLGHEHLEQKAKEAARRAEETIGTLRTQSARLQDALDRADASVATARLAEAEAQHAPAQQALAKLTLEREKAKELWATYPAALDAADAATKRSDALAATAGTIYAEIDALEEKIRNNEDALAEATVIREAAARLTDAQIELGEARRSDAAARASRALLATKLEAAASEAHAAQRLRDECQASLAALRAVASGRAELNRAARSEVGSELANARAAVATRDAELVALRTKTLDVAGQRIGALRHGLEHVIEVEESAVQSGSCPAFELGASVARGALSEDDAFVSEATAAPNRIREHEALRAKELAAIATLEARDRADRAILARRGDIERAELELTAALAKLEAHETAVREAAQRRDTIASRRDAEPSHLVWAEVVARLEKEVAALEPHARKIGPLTNAETRLEELRPQLARAVARVENILMEQRAIVIRHPESPPDLTVLDRQLAVADAALRSVESAIASWQWAIATALRSAGTAAALRAEVELLEQDVADWYLLRDSLGRNGVQALEIDAIGPEATTLANDFLHSCLGPRFSVELTTTRPNADGDEKEGFWIIVHDAESNRIDEARSFSGGERILIAEAIFLTNLTILCRKSGIESPTLVRDETSGMVSAGMAPSYIAMLRRACKLIPGGAARVLFISHNPELHALADSRLYVHGGIVSETPQFRE